MTGRHHCATRRQPDETTRAGRIQKEMPGPNPSSEPPSKAKIHHT